MGPYAHGFWTPRRTPLVRAAARRAGVLGSVPAWLPLAIVLGGALWLWTTTGNEVRLRAGVRVDLTRSAFHSDGAWVPPQWSATLRALVARKAVLFADEPGALEGLCSSIEALPFVAQVGPRRFIQPDGLDLSLRLHRPIACVRVGSKFYPVAMIPDEEQVRGVLLPGAADGPHRVGSGAQGFFLPVLAGFDGAGLDAPHFGQELQNGSVLAALDIARSLAEHLNPRQRARMDRVLIDATSTEAFDGLPGGARLDLEGVGEQTHGRRIHFGDAPCEAGPGELPVDLKWAHVIKALELGFDAVDVRFDVAEYHSKVP
jgi:hypothetical protein